MPGVTAKPARAVIAINTPIRNLNKSTIWANTAIPQSVS
jgi:hypothetical protein